jgi:hypothetical protein
LLHVPPLPEDVDVLTAAQAYADAGWYVGPVRRSTKNPGTVLGKGWQHKTSRDADQIAAWFAGTDHGVFLHAGRSGAVIFDVDHPENLPAVLTEHLDAAPCQVSSPDHSHGVFATDRAIGNSNGQLGGEWGDVRGVNGVVITAPSMHPDGHQYRWVRTGAVPPLPEAISVLLPDAQPSETSATSAQIVEFLDAHTDTLRPELLDMRVRTLEKKIANGESRHNSLVPILAGAMTEARCGYFSARVARDGLFDVFCEAATRPGKDQRTEQAARDEFLSLLAWAVGQANAADLDDVRRGIEERVPDIVTPFIAPAEPKPVKFDRTHLSDEKQREEAAFDQLEDACRPHADAIWSARPALAAMRRQFLSRGAAPITGLLGYVLPRVLCRVPSGYVIDSGIGAPCELNLFTVPLGIPGRGKDVPEYPATLMIPIADGVKVLNPGSGQAIANAFHYEETRIVDGKEKKSAAKRSTVLIRIREGEDFTKAARRDGSNLTSQMRVAFDGGDLGQAIVGEGRKARTIEAGTYRLCATISIQPALAGPLFTEQGGLLERWLFVPAGSRECADEALWDSLQAEWPQEVSLPNWKDISSGVQQNKRIILPPAVQSEIFSTHRALQAGMHDNQMAHCNLLRQRIMYAFTLLNGRVQPNEEDWMLAGHALEISFATAAWGRAEWEMSDQCMKTAAAESRALATRKGRQAADLADEEDSQRLAAILLEILGEAGAEGLSGRDISHDRRIRRKFTATQMYAELVRLRKNGLVRSKPPDATGGRGGTGGSEGSQWWLI